MSVYYRCDRCDEESGVVGFKLPVPDGHHSRTDCWKPMNGFTELCNECVISYRQWFLGGKVTR